VSIPVPGPRFRVGTVLLAEFGRVAKSWDADMPVKPHHLLCILALAALPIGSSTLCRAADRPVIGWQGRTMGTVYSVRLVDAKLAPQQLEELETEIEERLEEINRQMSNYLPDSEVSRFNRAPANEPFKVSPEFASVVRFSLELARRSNGAFDPTLGPVIKLWGFGEGEVPQAVPPKQELEAAMKKTGWRHLSVTEDDELLKNIPGLTINLGGIGKGFGTDEIVRLLRARGLTDAYVSIAGEVRVLGHSPRGDKWRLGISAPVDRWRENDP
jgi:thiamine biosynthesis lipoprotein